MGVIDIGWTIYQKLITPLMFILTISNMFVTFGAFMGMLITTEILMNIALYLCDDLIFVKIVVATALIAIACKVIIMDFEIIETNYVYSIAIALFAACMPIG